MEYILENGNSYNINEKIKFDIKDNTLDISEISLIDVKGVINIIDDQINYDLKIHGNLSFDNHLGSHEIAIKYDEKVELKEEIETFNKKTLDLQAKIWENIVVDISHIKYEYNGDVTEGIGWKYMSESDFLEDEVDDRMSPLLKLLEDN